RSPRPVNTRHGLCPFSRLPIARDRQQERADMANKTTDQNATPVDPNDPLRGGTQGGAHAPLTSVGGTPGGTNSISPQGNTYIDRPEQHGGGTRTESRDEPEE